MNSMNVWYFFPFHKLYSSYTRNKSPKWKPERKETCFDILSFINLRPLVLYWKRNFHMTRSVRRSFGWSVCNHFLKHKGLHFHAPIWAPFFHQSTFYSNKISTLQPLGVVKTVLGAQLDLSMNQLGMIICFYCCCYYFFNAKGALR